MRHRGCRPQALSHHKAEEHRVSWSVSMHLHPRPGSHALTLHSPSSLAFSEESPQVSFLSLNLSAPCTTGYSFMLGTGLVSGPKEGALAIVRVLTRLGGEPCGKTPLSGFAAVPPVMWNRMAMIHFSALTADVRAGDSTPWLPPDSPARSPGWVPREMLSQVKLPSPFQGPLLIQARPALDDPMPGPAAPSPGSTARLLWQ